MDRMRLLLRRRAAWIMGASVTLFGAAMWLTNVLIPAPPISDLVVYQPGQEGEDEVMQKPKKPITSGKPPVAPPVPSVIVSTTDISVSDFTVDMPVTDAFSDASGEYSDGEGDGLGEGVGPGNNKGGMGSAGKAGSGFAGVFYDFKKKADGKPSPLGDRRSPYANGEVLALESRFVANGWNLSTFSQYFRPKMQLSASCFFMPNCLDKEATAAYDPEGRYGMKIGRWAAVYRAKVKAPVSGKFRFVGAADSAMAVRFDGKDVLFCGLHNIKTAGWHEFCPEVNPNAHKGREIFPYKGCEAWNATFGGFVAGSVFSVKAGQWYEMQVMITEIGGGTFGFCLLIDDVDGSDKKRTKEGLPLFQLFRTAFSEPTTKSAYEALRYKDELSEEEEASDTTVRTDFVYDHDSSVWEAKPVGPEVRMK